MIFYGRLPFKIAITCTVFLWASIFLAGIPYFIKEVFILFTAFFVPAFLILGRVLFFPLADAYSSIEIDESGIHIHQMTGYKMFHWEKISSMDNFGYMVVLYSQKGDCLHTFSDIYDANFFPTLLKKAAKKGIMLKQKC